MEPIGAPVGPRTARLEGGSCAINRAIDFKEVTYNAKL